MTTAHVRLLALKGGVGAMSIRWSLALVCAIGGMLLPAIAEAQPLATIYDKPPVPLTAFSFLPGDYSIESLLINEQGRVRLLLDISDSGDVTNAEVIESSGSEQLNRRSIGIAKARWRFRPATLDGRPVAASVGADGIWTLPLESVSDHMARIQKPLPPATAIDPSRGTLPKALTSHAVVATDYPAASIANHEQGKVLIRYLVDVDGNVGDVQLVDPSGFPALDDAATRMVKERWKFQPAMEDGKLVSAWILAEVLFVYRSVPQTIYPRPADCRDRPTFSNDRFIAEPDGSYRIRQQILVDGNGNVKDVQLLTSNGWMYLNKNLLFSTQLVARYAGRPSGALRQCWYTTDAVIPVSGPQAAAPTQR